MIKINFAILSIIFIVIPSFAFAGETVTSYVEWITPGDSSPLICELASGPEHIMQGELRCYINKTTDGTPNKGNIVFKYRDDNRSPISVAPALGPVSNSLITMWESGAYACYIVFGYKNGNIEKLFEHCSKGGIETIDDGSDGIIFIVTDYVDFKPTNATIYHWSAGSINKYEISYNDRLNKINQLQTRHNKSLNKDTR